MEHRRCPRGTPWHATLFVRSIFTVRFATGLYTTVTPPNQQHSPPPRNMESICGRREAQPLQEFTHLFKHPIETLMKKSLESKKSWFATIRAGRIVYDDTILQDKFATQGPLQKWVGISSIAFKTRTTIYRTFTRSNNIRMGEGNRNITAHGICAAISRNPR